MPRRPEPLPPAIAMLPSFASTTARRAGVGFDRLAAADLVRPYRGVRMRRDLAPTPTALAEAYGRAMPRGQFFSHLTAAQLLGAPLPLRLERRTVLDVSVLDDRALPRSRGVHGHRLRSTRTRVIVFDGLRMTDAPTTWCHLGEHLEPDDLVAVGDAFVTGEEPTGGLPGLTTIARLREAVERNAGRRGMSRVRAALEQVRYGSLSRRETLARLMIVRAGLPEPMPNHRVHRADGTFVAMVDLAFPEYRVGVEYESLLHMEAVRFRRDIHRYERLADAGWLVVRLVSDDLRPGARSAEAVSRIARHLGSRGWSPRFGP